MEHGKNIVDAKRISSALGGIETLHYPSVDSTNTLAKQLVKSGKKPPFLITADAQTSGRGRQGKSFYSPEGTGIYMSLVTEAEKNSDFTKATAAAAVAVCRAIESLTDKKPEIKWVNDILLDGKKICGILCESVFENGSAVPVITGIGLNLTTESFPSDIENAGSLFSNVSKTDLICEIASNLLNLLSEDISSFLPYYKSRSSLLGKEISFCEHEKTVFAKAVDIDETGALVVKLRDGAEKRLFSGEITVRKIGN